MWPPNGAIFYLILLILIEFTNGQQLSRSKLAAASYNNFVYFAGGTDGASSWVVDIWNSVNNTWQSTELSVARSELSATTLNANIIFAGGITIGTVASKRVDIFNQNTDSTKKPIFQVLGICYRTQDMGWLLQV
jgi:hypothetical protein